MNKLKLSKKHLSLLLVCVLMATTLLGSSNSNFISAAKKATLKTKTLSLKVGEKKKIQIKNKKKGAKYSFTAQKNKKSYVSISKSGKVTAKRAGNVKITVKETYKKKKRTVGIMTIKIKKKGRVSNTDKPAPTNAPSTNTPATPTPVPIPTPAPINPYEDTNYTAPS